MRKIIIILSLLLLNTACTPNISIIQKESKNNKESETKLVSKAKKTSKTNKIIYLTFDDGPSKYTPKVLEILKKNNIKATFFVTGLNKKYFKYIHKAHKEGHQIGLHTYTHNYQKVYKSTTAYFNDLNKIQNLVYKQTGVRSKIIRFPGGTSNTVSRKYNKGIMKKLTKQVHSKGYEYFDWNLSCGDGSNGLSVNKIYKNSIKSKSKKIILLMHDANGKENTIKALPKIIKYYKKKGYTFKVLDKKSFKVHHPINN